MRDKKQPSGVHTNLSSKVVLDMSFYCYLYVPSDNEVPVPVPSLPFLNYDYNLKVFNIRVLPKAALVSQKTKCLFILRMVKILNFKVINEYRYLLMSRCGCVLV